MSAFEMKGATARLVCDPGDDPHVEVAVYDGRLEPLPLAYNLGRVEVGVVPGAYKVEFRTGAETRSRIAVVGEGEDRSVYLDEPLPVASAAPVDGSSTSHEYQTGPAAHESRQPPLPPAAGQAGGSQLFLFVRDHDEEAASGDNPAAGLSLHGLDGRLLHDLGAAPEAGGSARYDAHARWTSLHAELDPGAYLLRLETAAKGIVQQAVHLREGWQTQVFLLSRSYGRRGDRRRQADLARGSVFMARTGRGFEPGDRQLYLTEVALRALADGRTVPGEDRSAMLWEKFENPMLGLYGACLHLRRPRVDVGLMRTVFGNLFRLLGPHPDVLALGWAVVARAAAEGHPPAEVAGVRQAVLNAGAISVPPMLRAGNDAVAAASFTQPGLVAPDSLAERVTTRMLLSGPWLLWTATADELRDTPLPPAAAPSAHSLVARMSAPAASAPARGRRKPSSGSSAKTAGRVGASSLGFALDVEAWEAIDVAAAAEAAPAPAPEPVLQGLQRSLDGIARRLDDRPELAARLLDDPSLSPLERRAALAAFPQADPLFAAMTRRKSAAASALLQTTRPTAAELAAALRAPAGTLSRAVLGLAARLEQDE